MLGLRANVVSHVSSTSDVRRLTRQCPSHNFERGSSSSALLPHQYHSCPAAESEMNMLMELLDRLRKQNNHRDVRHEPTEPNP